MAVVYQPLTLCRKWDHSSTGRLSSELLLYGRSARYSRAGNKILIQITFMTQHVINPCGDVWSPATGTWDAATCCVAMFPTKQSCKQHTTVEICWVNWDILFSLKIHKHQHHEGCTSCLQAVGLSLHILCFHFALLFFRWGKEKSWHSPGINSPQETWKKIMGWPSNNFNTSSLSTSNIRSRIFQQMRL